MCPRDLSGDKQCGHTTLLTDAEWKEAKLVNGNPTDFYIKYAGYLDVNNKGRVSWWSNDSGHFKPSPGGAKGVASIWSFPSTDSKGFSEAKYTAHDAGYGDLLDDLLDDAALVIDQNGYNQQGLFLMDIIKP